MYFFSPAKINLFLKLHGKTELGLHKMTTQYQVISLGDDLFLTDSHQDALFCNRSDLNSTKNLIWKSVQVFREYTGIQDPVTWHLHKRIPLEAGLGGGSSNAATALYALNAHFQTHLSDTVLQELGKSIGMDVPLFFSSGSAIGTGCGEHILEAHDECLDTNLMRFVLYYSEKGVSTKQAFSHVLPEDMKEEIQTEGFSWENDLEKPVFRFRPDLKEYKEALERIWSPFRAYVLMSGSGATLFVGYPKALEKDLAVACAIRRLIQTSQGVLVDSLYREKGQWFSHLG